MPAIAERTYLDSPRTNGCPRFAIPRLSHGLFFINGLTSLYAPIPFRHHNFYRPHPILLKQLNTIRPFASRR